MIEALTGKLHSLRVATFFGGSLLCATINNVILIVGDWFGMQYVPLLFICYIASSSVGYLYHCRITFAQPMSTRSYASFVAGIWLGLPVSLALITVMLDWMAMPMLIAAPVMTLIMFLYHYLAAHLAITR